MELDLEVHPEAFVGIIFNNRVIFNILENDVCFLNSGLSIINQLNTNRNLFVSKIIESQTYSGIKYIFDDEIVFSDFYDIQNENRETFSDVMNLIQNDNIYEYFYMLDLESNKLIIKIPEIPEIFALEYTNNFDIKNIINSLNNPKEI